MPSMCTKNCEKTERTKMTEEELNTPEQRSAVSKAINKIVTCMDHELKTDPNCFASAMIHILSCIAMGGADTDNELANSVRSGFADDVAELAANLPARLQALRESPEGI
jgi:hypothetical protein